MLSARIVTNTYCIQFPHSASGFHHVSVLGGPAKHSQNLPIPIHQCFEASLIGIAPQGVVPSCSPLHSQIQTHDTVVLSL